MTPDRQDGNASAIDNGMFTANWKKVMEPVTERIPLEQVADWYWQTVNWRISELAAGRGTPYDYDAKSCVTRGMMLMKFPWLSIRDLVELVRVIARRKEHNKFYARTEQAGGNSDTLRS